MSTIYLAFSPRVYLPMLKLMLALLVEIASIFIFRHTFSFVGAVNDIAASDASSLLFNELTDWTISFSMNLSPITFRTYISKLTKFYGHL